MGCRPSKHATSKIRDAHARTNHCTCMYSPRKYNKKHKCKNAGAGSRRTSGGTQSGSHGHSSTGHRSRSPRSEDIDFPAFSTTTAVYRRSASKASKITLRLSSDGSTLEIEQCEYDIMKFKPPVKSVFRPWKSAPNLAKISEKDGSMFQNIDLQLRPSASAWTNTPASRSTPGSENAPCSWRAYSAKRGRGTVLQTLGNENGIHCANIGEPSIFDNCPSSDGYTRESHLHNNAFNINRLNRTYSDYNRDRIISNSFSQATIHAMDNQREASFPLLYDSALSKVSPFPVSSSSVPNHNLFCLSQFGHPYSAGSQQLLTSQHQERCTASLRNTVLPDMLGYNRDTGISRYQSHVTDNVNRYNENRRDLKKLDQRASIPRYDCFRIRDYNNISSQSTSSLYDNSLKPDEHIENIHQCDWLDRWQRPSTHHHRARQENSLWTEKLTDRDKLVLNLSTRPSSFGSNGYGFTALVGLRDENWHSNDNVISGQIHDQPSLVSVLNSPVESDSVLKFVELGCPVTLPEDHLTPATDYSVGFFSSAHTSTCSSHHNLLQNDSIHQSEWNKAIASNNNSGFCGNVNGRSNGKDFLMREKFVSNDFENSVVNLSRKEISEQYMSVSKQFINPGSPVKRKKNINNFNSNIKEVSMGHNRPESEFQMSNNTNWRVAEIKSSQVKHGRYEFEMADRNMNQSVMTSPQSETANYDYLKNRKELEGCQRNMAGNRCGWSGKMVDEEWGNVGSGFSTNMINDNKNANQDRRKTGDSLARSQSVRKSGMRLVSESSLKINEESIKLVKDQSLRLYNDSNSKEMLSNDTSFYQSKESYGDKHEDRINDLNSPSARDLPLLCYNNSFGEYFDRASLRGNCPENQEGQTRGTTGDTPGSLAPVNGQTRRTSEVLDHYQDKIDRTFHPTKSPFRESGGFPPPLIEPSHVYHRKVELKGEIDTKSVSEKPPVAIKALITTAYRVESDVIKGVPATQEFDSCQRSCEENDRMQSVSNDENNKYDIVDGTLSTFPRTPDGDSETSLNKSRSVDGKTVKEYFTKNNHQPFSFSPTLSTTQVARSPIPLRVLQARIIGRNIFDFANECMKVRGKEAISVSTHTAPSSNVCSGTKSSSSSLSFSSPQVKKVDGDSEITQIDRSYQSSGIQNNEKQFFKEEDKRMATKSELQSKYAIPQTQLTDEAKCALFSSCTIQIPDSDRNYNLSNSDEKVAPIGSNINLRPNLASSSFSLNTNSLISSDSLPTSITSSLTSSVDTRDPNSTSPQAILDLEAFSSLRPMSGEFSSQGNETLVSFPGHSSPHNIPLLPSCSNETLVNAQLLSSHSSDSLSCSLSSYSLSHTLHSDNAQSDTPHSDTTHSDSFHSDTSHYDTTNFDSSQIETPRANSPRSNDSLIHSVAPLHTQMPSASHIHHSQTLKMTAPEAINPSSFPSSQSHSPRSSPPSTPSPHTSPSSQSTLSPHSTPLSPSSSSSSSTSQLPIPENTYSLHEKTAALNQFSDLNTFTQNTIISSPQYLMCLSSPSPPSPSPPPPRKARDTIRSGLSILAPSMSCPGTSAEDPKSHQNQPIIDPNDRTGLNPTEIQNSPQNPARDRHGDQAVKWDTIVSGGTRHKMREIVSWQNSHGRNNKTVLSDGNNAWDSNRFSDGMKIKAAGDDDLGEYEGELHIARFDKRGESCTEKRQKFGNQQSYMGCDPYYSNTPFDRGEINNSLNSQIGILKIEGTILNLGQSGFSDPTIATFDHARFEEAKHCHDEDGIAEYPDDSQQTLTPSCECDYSLASIHDSSSDVSEDYSNQNCPAFSDVVNNEITDRVGREDVEDCTDSIRVDKIEKGNDIQFTSGGLTLDTEPDEHLNGGLHHATGNITNQKRETCQNYFPCDTALMIGNGYHHDKFCNEEIKLCDDVISHGEETKERSGSSAGVSNNAIDIRYPHASFTKMSTSANNSSDHKPSLKILANEIKEGEEEVVEKQKNTDLNYLLSKDQISDRASDDDPLTPLSRSANQIDIEATAQIADDQNRLLTATRNVSSFPASADTSQKEQCQNSGIDSSYQLDVVCNAGLEQTNGKKIGRVKRNVQFLVKHFESVTLKRQAELETQEKL